MKHKKLIIDFAIVFLSIGATYLMSKYHLVYKLEHIIISDYILAFIAGMFFISFFTVIPASYILINLLGSNEPLVVALIAGMGAVAGDLIIFIFVKNRFSHSFFSIFNFREDHWIHKLKEYKFIKILMPVIGAAIIASPFPDEIGVSLMGAARMKKRYFIPISYILNFVGIYILLVVSETV